MKVEFWEGKTKRYEADLPVVPAVGDRVSLPAVTGTATVPVLSRLFVIGGAVRVTVGPSSTAGTTATP